MGFLFSAFESGTTTSSSKDDDTNDSGSTTNPASGGGTATLNTAEAKINAFTASATGITTLVNANTGVAGTPQGITLTEVAGISTLPACYSDAKAKSGVTFVNFNIADSKCFHGTQSLRTGPTAYKNPATSVTVCNPGNKHPYNGCGAVKKLNNGTNWGVMAVEGKGVNGFELFNIGANPLLNKTLDECAAEAEKHTKARAFTRTDDGQCFIKSYGVLGVPFDRMADGVTTWRRYGGTAYTPPIDASTQSASLSAAPGWPGATNYKEFNLSGGIKNSEVNTFEECRTLAAGADPSENINTFMVRTSDHPGYPQTCVGIRGDSFENMDNQAAWTLTGDHITACVDPANNLGNGCVNPLDVRKRSMAFPSDIAANAAMGRGFDDQAREREDITSTASGSIPNRSECLAAATAAGALVAGYDNSDGSCYMIKKGFLGPKNGEHPTRWMECTNGHPIANGCQDPATMKLILTSEGWTGVGARSFIASGGSTIQIAPNVFFQADGNMVIRNGSTPVEWASGWRNNRITLKNDGDLWYDNADGNYGKSLNHTPWDLHHKFGAFDDRVAPPGEARGPFGLWWVKDGAKIMLKIVDRHGAIVWTTSTGHDTEVSRRKSEARRIMQESITNKQYSTATADANAWKGQSLITEGEYNGFMDQIDQGTIAQDRGISLFSLGSLTPSAILISTTSNGTARILPKTAPITVGAGGSTLSWQGDGNLVLYHNGQALWASGTNHSTEERHLVMQDHNVFISNGVQPIWDLNGSMGAGIPYKSGKLSHFGISGGGLIFIREQRKVWESAGLVANYLAFPRMGDRPGLEMQWQGGWSGKMEPTEQTSVVQCAKYCTDWKGYAGFLQSVAPKICTGFSYNPSIKKCYMMDASREGEVGEVVNGYTYYRKL